MKKTIVLVLVLVVAVEVAKADFKLGVATKVPNINSSSSDYSPSITPDGLMLYFSSNRDSGDDQCYIDIWVTTRATKDEPWGTPTNIGPPINTSGPEGNCCISADGLELYFGELWPPIFLASGCQPRPEGYGYGDIWVSSRETTDSPWGEPVNLGPRVNSSAYEDTPNISADGLTLYFSSDRRSGGSGLDIYVTTRLSRYDPWGPAVEVGPPINTVAPFVSFPFISSDNLSLTFMGAPLDYAAKGDIYLSRRATASDPWGQPVRLPSLNTSRNEESLIFASGDSTLYFSRSDPYNPNQTPDPAHATFDIWQVEVTPVVDLNDDKIVDSADMVIMVDNWHTESTLCDIAPAPFGDGFVDVQDLIVLADHLFEEISR